jgi:tetratricopeptide (TPR) repeat protein
MSKNRSETERNPIEVLAEEFAERHRNGELPTIAEYAAKYPELANEIEALFPSVILVEKLGTQHRQATHGGKRWAAAAIPRMQRLGDFHILREVGRGGMGIVYEAEQESLGRRVALKVLPSFAGEDQRQRQRFEREARAAARLHHTNIVPVFGIGREGELCYYVMQLIDGIALDRWSSQTDDARRGAPEHVRRVAEIGVQAAEGLQYAHSQGIVHRDIKPANLLVDNQGTVWITDFGVARLAEEEGLTRAGDFVGTLRYLPPEQISGQPDARSDVYSLGLTLYELLAGRPAFTETNHTRLVLRIAEEDPPPLGSLQSNIPRDLDTIVSKAIARDPRHRYQSAGELADDLHRFLEDRPIRARRVSLVGRLWRWGRRNRTVAALSGLAAAAILVAMVVGWVGYLNTRRALRQTEEAVGRAEGNLDLSLEALESVFGQIAGRDWLLTPVRDPETEPFSTSIPSEENAALLERLLGFYERFAAKNDDSSRLFEETAKAYRRVGEIQARLGRPDKAEKALRRSLAVYQTLANSAPGTQRYEPELAVVYNDLGFALLSSGRYGEARQECFERVLDILGADRSEKSCLQRIRALNSLGRMVPIGVRRSLITSGLSSRKKRPPSDASAQEAEHRHREALSIAQGLLDRDPQNADYRFLLAQTYRYLGQRHSSQDQAEEAGIQNDHAVDILEKLVADFPSIAHYKVELAEAYAAAGVAASPRLEATARRARLDKARQLADELVNQHPRVPDYAALAARIRAREGMAAAWAGNRPEAEKAYRQATESFQRLADRYPAIPMFSYLLCLNQATLGEYLRTGGQLEQSRTELEKAIAGLESLLQSKPGIPPAVRSYSRRVYQSLSRTLEDLGDRQAAAAIREKVRGEPLLQTGTHDQKPAEPK